MKNCKNCKVDVSDNTEVCPLCKTVLTDIDEKQMEETYPQIESNLRKYNIITRIFLFLFIGGSVITALINYVTYTGVLWSVIYISAVLYSWSVIRHALKSNSNIAYKFFMQTIFIGLFTVIIDNAIGYRGWSVNYVVPELIITSNIAVLILIIVNRIKWHDYVIYQLAIAAMGFIPVVLLLLKIIHEPIVCIISAILSFLILCGTIIFSDKNVRNEFKRRFRF